MSEPMNDLKTSVLYIATAIEIGDYNKKTILNRLDETIVQAKESTFVYEVFATHREDKQKETFIQYGRGCKAKVISTLEDIRAEISTKRPSKRFILWMLQNMLKTNFYQDKLQKQMVKDRKLARNTTTHTDKLEVY